jgi:hypothetical protein
MLLNWQSTHVCVLQALVERYADATVGHGWPPFCGWTLMVRCSVWNPPPHSLEHEPTGVHWLSEQLIGKQETEGPMSALQVWVCSVSSASHAAPPNSG